MLPSKGVNYIFRQSKHINILNRTSSKIGDVTQQKMELYKHQNQLFQGNSSKECNINQFYDLQSNDVCICMDVKFDDSSSHFNPYPFVDTPSNQLVGYVINYYLSASQEDIGMDDNNYNDNFMLVNSKIVLVDFSSSNNNLMCQGLEGESNMLL